MDETIKKFMDVAKKVNNMTIKSQKAFFKNMENLVSDGCVKALKICLDSIEKNIPIDDREVYKAIIE